MAKLSYISPMSLDGYLGDGKFDWSSPSETSVEFITNVIRPIGTYVYGRRLYETMAVWESPEFVSGLKSTRDQEFARVWQSANKIVFSKTLNAIQTRNTRLEREFDSQQIRELKASCATDICIGGANLAAQAIRAGLVDEIQLFVVPVSIGGGISVFPKDTTIPLNLIEERGFAEGWIYLRYQMQV